MSPDEIRSEVQKYDWYHKINLGNGIITPGRNYEMMWEPTKEFMRKVDFQGKKVLDIGSWDGTFSFFAESLGAASVTASDLCIQPTLNFAARVLGSKVEQQEASVYNLGMVFPPESFDIVILNGVLYHLMAPLFALLSINTVLKPAGLILLESAFHDNGRDEPYIYVSYGEDEIYPGDSGSCTFPSPRAYRYMVEIAMFTLDRLECYYKPDIWGRILIQDRKRRMKYEERYNFYEYSPETFKFSPKGWRIESLELN